MSCHSRITIRDLIDNRRRSIAAAVVDDDHFGVDGKAIDFRRDLAIVRPIRASSLNAGMTTERSPGRIEAMSVPDSLKGSGLP